MRSRIWKILPLQISLLATLLMGACQPLVRLPDNNTPSLAKMTTPQVLVHGAPIHHPNGVQFGPNGNLYVASVVERAILMLDPETGEIRKRFGIDVGVEGPDDLTFGPDGSLYWAAFLKGEIGRLSPDGVFTSQMIEPGVNPIAMTGDGRLFAGLAYLNDAFYELDANLSNPPQLLAADLGWLNSFQFGPDGLLYAPLVLQGQVVRIDVNTQPLQVETIADGLNAPASVKLDSQGHIYVSSTVLPFYDGITRIDPQTGDEETVITLTVGIDSFTFSPDDRLFISHIADGAIYEVMADQTLRTVSPAGMIAPGGIALLERPDGQSVFVADFYTLREFDSLTGEARTVMRNSGMPENVTLPFTAAADGANLILTSFIENKVQIWDPWQGKQVAGYTDFQVPINAIRFQDDLVVAELGTASVVRASGADPTQRSTLSNDLGIPAGLAATDDDLWVSDYATGIVWQLIADGEMLAPAKQIVGELAGPEGMAVTADQQLLVVETAADRLIAIDLATNEVHTVVDNLGVTDGPPGGGPPTWVMSSVAVDSSGVIYVTGDEANVIYRLEPEQ